jgi:hypothetical protein
LKRKDVGWRREGLRSQEKDFENAPPGPTKVPNCFAPLDSMSDGKEEGKNIVTLKTHEQHGDVYENKGSAFHILRQSGKLIENTGSCELKAGMLLKRKDVGLGRAVFRNQEPLER